MGLSPSALSHTIRNLETRLDVRLFNRTTRSVALTETGERLLQRVRPALADLTEAVDEAGSAQDHPRARSASARRRRGRVRSSAMCCRIFWRPILTFTSNSWWTPA